MTEPAVDNTYDIVNELAALNDEFERVLATNGGVGRLVVPRLATALIRYLSVTATVRHFDIDPKATEIVFVDPCAENPKKTVTVMPLPQSLTGKWAQGEERMSDMAEPSSTEASRYVTFYNIYPDQPPGGLAVFAESPLSGRDQTVFRLVASQARLYLGKQIRWRMLEGDDAPMGIDPNVLESVTQGFVDLEHQIKAPIRQAQVRIASMIRNVATATRESQHKELFFVRGILRRASRVAACSGLYADLANGRPLRVKLATTSIGDLQRVLIESAMDYELLARDARAIRVSVDRESFERHSSVAIEADTVLFEQAINNLLDNAVKYSYDNTVIQIRCAITSSKCSISVINHGLQIGTDEIERVKERGFRGTGASRVTGEGSGIGLWIVKNILKSHQGDLVVVPTTRDSQTEIRLLFPIVKRVR